MAAEIIAYDIPGSSYTGFVGNDYRRERAVRRFLVDGNGRKDKTTIISDVVGLIDDISNFNLYPQTVETDGNLPMQQVTIQKAGRSPDGNDSLWIVEAVYYYAI
jgi:hypothetical protein